MAWKGWAVMAVAMAAMGAVEGIALGGGLENANSPRLRYTGRWVLREGAMVTVNSGSVLETRFRGRKCVLRFDTRGLTEKPQVYVQIDRETPLKYTVADNLPLPVSGNADETHTLILTVKAVEEHQRNWIHLEGAVKFLGIETEGSLLEPAPDRRPLVEFVGDSITAGVMLGTEGNTTERMDGLLAYPAVTGDLLGVRVSQVGFGYLGILKPGNGEVPIADQSFPYCMEGAPVKHSPALVVINLGTNDGGKDKATFATAYRAYLQVVRKTYPQTVIACLRPFGGFQEAQIKTTVEQVRATDRNIHYVDTTGWIGAGDYTDGVHPNAGGNYKVSVRLAAALRPLLPARRYEALIENNIEYSNPDGQHLMVNMARPKGEKGPFPAILCIHGGGFRAGNRQGYDGLIKQLAERGYVAVTASYRLAPKYQFPAAVHDVKAAVRWLRASAKKYGIDPERIGVTGGSAGGHLAQFLGVTGDVAEFEGNGGNPKQSSRVAVVVNYFGPSDFTQSYGKSVDAAEVLPLFLGGNVQQKRQRHIQSSPLYWVTPNAAPTLCIHGTKDNYVAYEQATWIIQKLQAAGVEAELLTMEGAGHGFGGEDARRADEAMFAFFDSHLKR